MDGCPTLPMTASLKWLAGLCLNVVGTSKLQMIIALYKRARTGLHMGYHDPVPKVTGQLY